MKKIFTLFFVADALSRSHGCRPQDRRYLQGYMGWHRERLHTGWGWDQIVIGSGEGSNQQSNALYKYIKLVNKDVVDGINSVNTADNSTITELYTLGGARVNSLQKGINIVSLANGKTVKVIK